MAVEALVSPIVEILLDKLASLAHKEVLLIRGVENDLLKLQTTLTTIKAGLLDAEEQQLHNHQVSVWLEELKDVCYDAEDLFDEFEANALRREVIVKHGSIPKKVCNFLSWPKSLAFRSNLGHKIRVIRERLDEIASNRVKFRFTNRVTSRINVSRERETHSFVIASEMIGRDEDKEEVISLLMHPSCDDKNVSVIPIVGMAGLGKTALAKLVYNDQKIVEYFDLKLWICVSNDFVEKNIIIDIIKSAISHRYIDMSIDSLEDRMSMDHLQRVLRDILDGRKYLLVMDDVWNENAQQWIKLKSLLLGGANGSKIVITTRSNRAASIMSTMRGLPSYGCHLKGLSHESCMSLFEKYAFEEGQRKDPNLIKIGKDIVRKCGGLPLAVKTLGSLLYTSVDENDWKYVRDNEIWNLEQNADGILPALKLSYDQLPYHLKRCFAYLSVFPKDFEFSSLFVVRFWMASGFLQSYNQNEEMESIGMQCLKKLVSRSMFQDFKQLKGDHFSFKMHDLMHDLAISVTQNECKIVNCPEQIISKKVRHLSFIDDNTIKNGLPSFLNNLGHLRCILFPYGAVRPSPSFAKSCISMFPFLRVLDLRNAEMESLPEKLGNLKHLRNLYLSRNRKIKKLPNSICKLHNLITLNLRRCSRLEELPRDMKCLISLRTLVLTINQKRLEDNRIGRLSSLHFLQIESCYSLEYLFEGIDNLKALRTLRIVNCPNLLSLPRTILNLSSLESLHLRNCVKLNLNLRLEMGEKDSERELHSKMPHLRTLDIGGLPHLVKLPQWLLQCSTNTLQWLNINACPNFTALPESWENLEQLQVLHILGCNKLSSLPRDMDRLTALKELYIHQCPALSERCKQGTGEDWPQIAHVPKIKLDGNWIEQGLAGINFPRKLFLSDA